MPKDQCFRFYLPGASEEVTFVEREEEWWLPVVEVRRKQGIVIQGDGVPGLQNEKFWRSDTHKLNMPDTTELYSWEDALEEEMAAHSRIPAWEIPWTQEPGELTQNTTKVTIFIIIIAFKRQKLLKFTKISASKLQYGLEM